jgi:molybdenum cofactor cytidylyltransferase
MTTHGVIVLAAGDSRRLGQPKQQLRLHGQTLEQRAVALAAATGPAELLLVRRAADSAPLPTSIAPPLRRIVAPAGGMGRSLAAAVAASQLVNAGWLVLVVDQPGLDGGHLEALLRLWHADPTRPVASAYADTFGVPAVLPWCWREHLLRLDADQGARALLRAEPELRCIRAPVLAEDLDRPADLQRFAGLRADWKSSSSGQFQ